MFRSNGLHISDELRVTIGREAVQLRPEQGLRAVEVLLRGATRLMILEAADGAEVPPLKPKPSAGRKITSQR